jgi:hypothetical protein
MSTALDTSMNDGQLGDVELEHAKAIEGAPALRPRVDRQFDQQSERDWCILIRDIAAIANSDGGDLILRMPADAPALTRSDLLRRINEYSDSPFDEVELRALDSSQPAAVRITVGQALFPIVFTKAGWYVDPEDAVTRIEAFPAGAIFFWHADKSVPGGTGDLREFFERLVRRVRRRWIRGIRRVLTTPIDSLAQTAAARKGAKSKKALLANLQPVRITTDPDAPALQPQDVERLYPWRQKDLLSELNARLGRRALTTYDIQAVRRQHRLDARPDFVFHLPGTGRRYSPATADWFMERYARDSEFFAKARTADQVMLKLRRQKPK